MWYCLWVALHVQQAICQICVVEVGVVKLFWLPTSKHPYHVIPRNTHSNIQECVCSVNYASMILKKSFNLFMMSCHLNKLRASISPADPSSPLSAVGWVGLASETSL